MPLPLFVVSLAILLAAFGAVVWLLVKDRKYWRDQYQAVAQEARKREQQLFDQLVIARGFRAVGDSLKPQPHGVRHQPALDAEEMEIIDSRINERIEAGVMTASEGHLWANQIRDGSLTPAQLERMFWKRQQTEFPGSVADID